MRKGRGLRSICVHIFENLIRKSHEIPNKENGVGTNICIVPIFAKIPINAGFGLVSRITVIVCCPSNNASRFELRKTSSLALKGFANHPLMSNEQRSFGSGLAPLPKFRSHRSEGRKPGTFSGILAPFFTYSFERLFADVPMEEWSYKMPISADKLQATRAIVL